MPACPNLSLVYHMHPQVKCERGGGDALTPLALPAAPEHVRRYSCAEVTRSERWPRHQAVRYFHHASSVRAASPDGRRAQVTSANARPEGAQGLAVEQVAEAVAALDIGENTALIQHISGVRRFLARLGGLVSANVYYVYELAGAYWKHSIGYERATRMARLATVVREGIPLALHSDFTMAPAQPLNHAWVAVNRIGESGEVAGPEERLSLEQALRAITIDAAFVLGMEDEIGSIRAGKRADFTVLEADPYEEPVESLKDIPIWGTVFEGRPFPIQ